MADLTLLEYTNKTIPKIIKRIPKTVKTITILNIVGTGLHAGRFCCLNLDCFTFSYTKSSSSSGSAAIVCFVFIFFIFDCSDKFDLL